MTTGAHTTRDHAYAAIDGVLADMGIDAPARDRPLVVTPGATGRSVLRSDVQFDDFIMRFCLRLGCIPYAIEDVRGLSVAGLAERYVGDSHPIPPRTPMESHSSALSDQESGRTRRRFEVCGSRICFVLGVGRSGTTLFQAMLNRHPRLWAPGELHLALFDTMAERATGVSHPFLRQALAPEAAERFGETVPAFNARLEYWEQAGTTTVDVYRTLAAADTNSAVVDKTPTYARSRSDLEWIQHHFPDACFVHLVRDPLDVAGSFVRMQLHRQAIDQTEAELDPYHLAEATWYRHNTNIVSMLDDVAPDRWCRVRYEDLVHDPASALEPVCKVLGVEYLHQIADPYTNRTGPVTQGAGDPSVNRRHAVERPSSTATPFPLSAPTRRLAEGLGYSIPAMNTEA